MTEIYNHHSINIEIWNEKTFSQKESEWEELLINSDVDCLFLSWKWLYSWWSIYQKQSDMLSIVAIYKSKQLIALAPLYKVKDSYFKGLLPTTRLQFLGKRLERGEGIRAEYMDFIIHSDHQTQSLALLLSAIKDRLQWKELSFGDLNTSSINYKQIRAWIQKQGWHYRINNSGYTYLIDCTKNFDDYLKALGRNSRLKLFNRRKLLEAKGKVTLEPICDENKEAFFKILNDWNMKRWHSPAINQKSQKFFDQAFNLSSNKLSLKYSTILKLDNEPLSVMINLFCNGKIYNIQLGFIEDFDKKISLGTLHFGYMLETAFSDSSVTLFDFLEGSGKHSNYKTHIAQQGVPLESSQCFRGKLLNYIFSFYDRFLRK